MSYSSSHGGPRLYVMAARAARGAGKPPLLWRPGAPATSPLHIGQHGVPLRDGALWPCLWPAGSPRRAGLEDPGGQHCLWDMGRTRQIPTARVTHGQAALGVFRARCEWKQIQLASSLQVSKAMQEQLFPVHLPFLSPSVLPPDKT